MRYITLVFLITLQIILSAQDFEFVESFPSETILDHPDIRNTYDVWKEIIKGCKYKLDIAQFYISSEQGKLFEDILKLIKKASRRGVKIRILIDESFYRKYPQSADDLDAGENIEVRKIKFSEIVGGVMHAKYFIADDEIVFIGSQNFDWRALEHIQEIGVKIRNKELAKKVGTVFEMDWELAKSTAMPQLPKRETDINGFIKINNEIEIKPVFSPVSLTPPELAVEITELVKLIKSAKKEIFVQVMNYSPRAYGDYDGKIDNALRDMAGKDVKVKILVSDWSLKYPHIEYLKSLTFIPNIEVKYISFPRATDGYISYSRVAHSKFIIVDKDKFWLGSSNLEAGYFTKSRNVGIIVKGKKPTEISRRIFLNTWTSPYTAHIEPEKKYYRPYISD